MDGRSLSVADEDEQARSLYRGRISGLSTWALRVNPLQGIQYLKESVEEFLKSGEVWRCSLEHRCDGTVMVMLNRNFRSDIFPDCVHVECQDITEQYLPYL